MPEKVNLNAYFERIGFAGSIAPTLATLGMLHALHPAIIPFENLNPLMGEPVRLDQPSLERKFLAEKRGGYCFEHNLLFKRMLEDLDYTTRPLLARVIWNNPDHLERPPSHMLLLVEVNGQNYIADVGFGGLTLTAPLRLRAGVEQETPHETFRLSGGDPDWTLEARIGEDWRALYSFNLDPVSEDAIALLNQAIAADPASPFTHELRVALSPGGRRLKLHNADFTVQRAEADAEKREITRMETLRSVLTEEFGLTLPNDERLEPALAQFLPPVPPPAEPPAEPAPEPAPEPEQPLDSGP
ncbi:arylamine N-acetyltransferase [Devosia sp. YIM 151766]|uniref:arylamine N-acetyltransferase family protein n=1 Tax=Devosia sp. YIM 151766 TaxID=3017325 RepID=UPI00255C3306|nr:arylamine N-acetyltransferase [Devosia sp. YIM 151766]WIY52953.1 arylamine N-acetyltransferase [Devosia sp. YIM 151766]